MYLSFSKSREISTNWELEAYGEFSVSWTYWSVGLRAATEKLCYFSFDIYLGPVDFHVGGGVSRTLEYWRSHPDWAE